MSDTVQLLPLEAITLRILSLRGQRVIVDADLAALYDVPTKRLNEAVKRNRAKFPADSMFTLTDDEFAVLRSQSAISNAGLGGRGGRRYAPRVFTEHGALMAATVLSSPPAIKLSAYVVRAFVRLRELAIAHGDLARRLDELERKTEALTMQHDGFNRSTRNQLKHCRRITHLLIAGVTTEVCVQTSMRDANDRGFECLLVEDCTASYFPEFKRATIAMVVAQGGIVGWAGMLGAVKTMPSGRAS